jgi:hypothetical protein
VKGFPCKLNTLTSHDFFEFYTTTPGRLLPPKWSLWLPGWSNKTYFDQTLWQWSARVVLPVGVLLVFWLFVRWWYRMAAELSSGKKTIGWLLVVSVAAVMVSLIKYVLDEHVNITGPVLTFVENTLQWIFILIVAGIILWEFMKTRIRQDIEDEAPEEEGQAEEGGPGGSRSETLLFLLRKTLMVVLFGVSFSGCFRASSAQTTSNLPVGM